jgi:hypothetical protein
VIQRHIWEHIPEKKRKKLQGVWGSISLNWPSKETFANKYWSRIFQKLYSDETYTNTYWRGAI